MTSRAGPSSAEGPANCAVCFCELPGDPSRWETPNCKHQFCTKCILTWVKESNTCPICRKDVVGEQRGPRRGGGQASGLGSSRQDASLMFEDIVKSCAVVGAGCFIASIAAAFLLFLINFLYQIFLWIILLGTPLYFMAASTLPPDSAFEAKKELKRVVRGEHLQVNQSLLYVHLVSFFHSSPPISKASL